MGPGAELQDRGLTLAACRHALLHNMGVAAGESVLIVTDPSMHSIGDAFDEAARELTPVVRLVEIPVAERNGQEPTAEVAALMTAVDVVLFAAQKSLSWTDARVAATRRGARVGSMTSITEETLRRTLTVDYDSIRSYFAKVVHGKLVGNMTVLFIYEM